MNTYTGLATTYNAAIKTEAIRQSNFFSSIFQAKESPFPTLPCVPDRPAAYTDDLWAVVPIILWDKISFKRPSVAMFMLLTPFMFGSFVIITYYMGEVGSVMMAPKHATPPIDKLKHLWASSQLA